MWYEWAKTNRHQYPSDPVNSWADQPLPKFNEQFWTNSYQPYAEYEFHVTPKLNITPGVKFAGYTFDVLHHADDGATVGELYLHQHQPPPAQPPSPTRQLYGLAAVARRQLPRHAELVGLRAGRHRQRRARQRDIRLPADGRSRYQHAAHSWPRLPSSRSTPPIRSAPSIKGQSSALDADAYHIRFQSGFSSTIDNIR